jgi:hypothetical protein
MTLEGDEAENRKEGKERMKTQKKTNDAVKIPLRGGPVLSEADSVDIQ